MFRSHHLQRRANGIYYFRFYVPTYLLGRFNRREIVRSLQTRDRLEAERRLTFERARVFRLIDMARNLSELSETELEAISIRFYHSAYEITEAERLKTKLQEGEIEHRLTHHAEMIEIMTGNLERNSFRSMEDAVQEICDSEQIVNESDTDNYRRLAHLTLRAILQIEELMYAHTAGDYDAKPKDPLFLEATPQDDGTNRADAHNVEEEIPIGTVRDRFLEHHQGSWAETTTVKYTANTAVCCRYLGDDTSIKQITKANIRNLRDTLAKLPPNSAKRYPDQSISEIVRIAEEDNVAGMSPGSANAYLGSLSSLFTWAEKEGYVDTNPTSGITVADPVHGADKRSPFDREHLQTIFNAPTYTGMRSTHYWKEPGDQVERDGLVPQKFRIPISFTLPPFQTREGFSRLASNVCVVDCRSH